MNNMTSQEFNGLFPVGVEVRYHVEGGPAMGRKSATTGRAIKLGTGENVVPIKGREVAVPLDQITVTGRAA